MLLDFDYVANKSFSPDVPTAQMWPRPSYFLSFFGLRNYTFLISRMPSAHEFVHLCNFGRFSTHSFADYMMHWFHIFLSQYCDANSMFPHCVAHHELYTAFPGNVGYGGPTHVLCLNSGRPTSFGAPLLWQLLFCALVRTGEVRSRKLFQTLKRKLHKLRLQIKHSS